jgi:glycosyltransferase involved in cell wall biosynthesis
MFPSLSETFGNVTLEALASGVPAVVANAQGNRSLVEDGYNGFLVAPRSTKEFVDRIVSLVSDDELRRKFAVNALSFGSSFTWDRIFGGLIQHYYEVLADFDRT